MTKYQAVQNATITKDEIEAQKCLIDAAKELFIYHDYAKAQAHMVTAIAYLDSLQRKSNYCCPIKLDERKTSWLER